MVVHFSPASLSSLTLSEPQQMLHIKLQSPYCDHWCCCPCRGFVQPAHEERPVHHQRSRELDAGGDADAAAELWVKTTDATLKHTPGFGFVLISNVEFHIFTLVCDRNIFLGETFSSYISVHNDSSQVVKDILVKVPHFSASRSFPTLIAPLVTSMLRP